jgi:type IV pilus assembly protein PilA
MLKPSEGSDDAKTMEVPDRRRNVEFDAGFTLIELMVVLLILAILLAIAIPTFLGTSKSAKDRGAQQNLNSALVDSDTVFQTNNQSFALGTTSQYTSFPAFMATALASDQPALGFTTSTSASPSTVSVYVSAGGNGIVLANRSVAGNCWYTIDNPRAISTTINSANKQRPYGTGTATATATASPTTGTASAQTLYFPTAAGNYYAEVSGDTVTGDCSASNPKLTGTGSKFQIAQSTFPS